MSPSVINFFLVVLLWIGVALYLKKRMVSKDDRVLEYLDKVMNRGAAFEVAVLDADRDAHPRWLQQLIRLGNAVPLFSPAQRRELGATLVRAGWRSPSALPLLIACKLLTGGAVALLTPFYTLPESYDTMLIRSLLLLGSFVVGMIVPEYLLKMHITRRVAKIEHSLPDALDLLVICTNAGFSLGVSLERAAHELAKLCPPLVDELNVSVGELRLSGDSASVLHGLAERIGTPSIRSLVVTLLQSQQYGTPITLALRQLARSERAARILRLEEQAAKLATKITLPMMLFILPAVLVIAGGPALLNLKMVMFSH
jgi:tight adherence protein C